MSRNPLNYKDPVTLSPVPMDAVQATVGGVTVNEAVHAVANSTGVLIDPATDETVQQAVTALGQILSKLGTKLSVSLDGDSVTLTLPPGLALDASVQAVTTAIGTLIADIANNHADLSAIHADTGTTLHADLGGILTRLGQVLTVAGTVAVSNPITGFALDATMQAIKTALGSPLQAGGAVAVSNLPATQAVSGTVTVNAGTNTSTAALALESGGHLASVDGKVPTLVNGRTPVDGSGVTQPVSGTVAVSNQPAGFALDATLQSIKSVLLSQANVAESLWVDSTSGVFYLRRVTDTDGAVAISWTDLTGAAASPTVANLRPLASDNALTVTNTFYDVTTAGTGTSVGDVLNRVIIINKAVNPPAVAGALWINATTGAAISAPAAGSYAEATRDVAITSSVLPTGAAKDTSLASILAALQATLAIAGTVTANIGTTGGLGLDASLQSILTKLGTTLAISAASLPLPSGAATSALQSALATAVAATQPRSIVSNAPRVSASGTLGAANAAVTLALDGMNAGIVQLTGTWAGTVAWQASVDGGTTYFPVNMIPYGGGAQTASAIANGQWEMACGGLTHLQAVMSAYTSGSATALIAASNGIKSVRVGAPAANPIPIVPSVGSVTQTIATGTSGTLIAANPARKSLRWMNIGAADITVAPGTTAPTVGQGMVYTSTGAAKQGGGETFNDPAMATNAFSFAASASATIAVWECQ